jgi:hypothetical protein
MGGKYKWKADQNPALGSYDTDTYFKTMNKSKSAFIRADVSPFRRPRETVPDPGAYDAYLPKFG